VTATAVAAPAPEPKGPNHYDRGASFERKVSAALADDGYVVCRVAASKGTFDLVALKPGQVLLVQCKLSGPPALRPGEWNALYADAERCGALAVIASRPKRGQIAYHLINAAKTGVQGVRPPCTTWSPDEVT
jgi:Holliday junction resolvase